jgi:hypothetical protein
MDSSNLLRYFFICRIFTGFTTGNFGDDLNRVNIIVGLVSCWFANAVPK